MPFDTCYNGVVSLTNAAPVSRELPVDAGCEGIQIDSVQGAIREAYTDSVYTIAGWVEMHALGLNELCQNYRAA